MFKLIINITFLFSLCTLVSFPAKGSEDLSVKTKANPAICTIDVVKRGASGYGDIKVAYSRTKQATALDCFERAMAIAESATDIEGYAYDNSGFASRGYTFKWKKIVLWSFDDGYMFDSHGTVTPYSRDCMKDLDDQDFLGDKLYWVNCELIN